MKDSRLFDGEAIQVFVHFGSTCLERVGNNFYLYASGHTYSLNESDVSNILYEMNKRELNNPLVAASLLIDWQNNYIRISK